MPDIEKPAQEDLATDLLRTSDTICRKNVQALQQQLQAMYDQLFAEEVKKTPDLPEEEAQAEAEWRLRGALRHLRERLMVAASQQEEVKRQRNLKILEWARKRMA